MSARGQAPRQGSRGAHRRGQRGIALITVILALVALAVIAAPFALSMRGLEAQALLGFQQEAARADAELALAAACAHLQTTHPFLDADTPDSDDLAEIDPPDLVQRFPEMLARAPLGTIRSVSIADEQGRVDLATASPYLMGNLLGGRTVLTADVDATAQQWPVTATGSFPATGLLWAGLEQLEYSAVTPTQFGELRRGIANASLPQSPALPHVADDEVLDARLLQLAQHGWRIRPGTFDGFRRVDGLKEIALYGAQGYTADELDRVRASLTVQGGPLRFGDEQRIVAVTTGRLGGSELVLRDGRYFGQGSVVQLVTAHGDKEWNLVLSAVDWGGDEGWHVALLQPPALRHDEGSVASVLERAPVNVATASPAVLAALLTGIGRQSVVDVINGREAQALAIALVGAESGSSASERRRALDPQIRHGDFSAADVDAASSWLASADLQPSQVGEQALATRLQGLATLHTRWRVGAEAARTLAERIAAKPPRSHEDLRALLDAAVTDGVVAAEQRDDLLRNAVNSNDAAIEGGTAPFTYASGGVFHVAAAASRNFPNGKEQARTSVIETVAVAPNGESARSFATQRAFEDASRLTDGQRGWSSFPRLLQSGPGVAPVDETARVGTVELPAGDAGAAGPGAYAAPPANGQGAYAAPPASGQGAYGAPPASGQDAHAAPNPQADALRLGARGVSRAGTLLGDRPGAATEGEAFVAPTPVRSALPDTVHFDEGVPGLTGNSPRGFSFDQGAVVLPLAGLQPPIVSAVPLLGSFAVEFWFELQDVEAETILFDGGVGELEDRILIAMLGRELVLRVSDTGVADFEAVMPKGHAPPAGEIRYAFEDGLPLQAHVPYHVLALIGGARDRDLALFVDGLPRGRRSFTTALVEDVAANSGQISGVAGYGGEEKLRVESTAGFPDRGALRIGDEIVEYLQKTDDAFLLRHESDSDPFGGRGRRDTVSLDHPASELVELVGWTRPLGSEVASRGDGHLSSVLDKFAVAELDPTRCSDVITVSVTPTGGGLPVTVTLGTGINSSNATIPVRASGDVQLLPGTFQSTGGFAIIYCDYGRSAVVGQRVPNPNSPNNPSDGVVLPAQTTNGWLGGAEVIRYSGFNGSQLEGVQRNQSGIPVSVGGPASSLQSGKQIASVVGGSTDWTALREYVTTFDAAILGVIPELPANPRVLVFPISVGVQAGNLYNDFHPSPTGKLRAPSAVAQIGVDFQDKDHGTEWFRWNTATDLGFVRDEIKAINNVLTYVSAAALWNPNGSTITEDTVKQIDEQLDFRGQDRTPSSHHEASESVLPTIVLGRWMAGGRVPVVGIPGRHDSVTLVNPEGDKEWHRVNFASTSDEEWNSDYCLVGLRDAVSAEFDYTDEASDENYAIAGLDLNRQLEKGSDAYLSVKRVNADSRLYTRMLCSPSGELPTAPIESFHLGEDWSGRRSPGRAIVDELRFHAPATPGPLLPDNGRYMLAEKLEFKEDRQLRLQVEQLVFPYGVRRETVLGAGALEVLSQLPQAGGLLLVGEEIVGYAGLDPVDSGNVFLTARGLYGTKRAYHEVNEPVTPLLFWPVSPLSSSLSESGGHLALADASGFPDADGMVLVGDELVGYTRRDASGLSMPLRRGTSRLALDADGLLRGRFGTTEAAHAAGEMVRWMPERQRDRALLGHDVPESESFTLTVRAPGAFFTDLQVDATQPDPGVSLQLRAVLDGRASPHADPEHSPGLVAWSAADAVHQPSGRLQYPLGRQADELRLHLFAQWGPGAFDARDFRSNAWKLVPEVHGVVVGHMQPTLVLEREEWR